MYLGPDVLMPVASIIAGIAGVVLMFWRRVVGAFQALKAKLTGGTRK